MGYIRHEAIIVTAFDKEYTQKAKDFAKKLGLHTTNIVETINGYSSFLIAPDGSKEGWEESDKHERARKEFCEWSDNQYRESVYLDYAYISFGGDEKHCNIIKFN